MIKVLSGEMDTENVEKWVEEQGIREEDEVTVCELFDQYERKGRIEGRLEGRLEGKTEGIKCGEARRLVADIDKVMEKLHLTLEKACDFFEITVDKYEEVKRLV